MNYFDFTILGVMVVFGAIGAWRGLVREFLSLVTWGVAVVVVWQYTDNVASLFEGRIRDEIVRRVLAFTVLFGAVILAGTLISLVVTFFRLQQTSFHAVNALLGGLFGAVRGAFIVVIVFLIAGITSFPQSDWWRGSVLSSYFEDAAVYASRYIPQDIARQIHYD
jgi:membrane protein required for colicin V production